MFLGKIKIKLYRIIFLTALMAVFLYFSPVYAKSGCCSHHGGVCCECGSQSNGKVICNDGWRGSSCYYSEMVKCGGGYTTPASVVELPEPSPYIYHPPSPSPIIYIPSLSPKPSPLPSSSPSLSTSPSPTPIPKSSPSAEPASSPEVKGEKTEPASTTEVIGGLGTMGALGWGGYNLLKNITKRSKIKE